LSNFINDIFNNCNTELVNFE